MRTKLLLIISIFCVISKNLKGQQRGDKNYKVSLVAETGYLSVLGHQIQFGQNGTYFDYKRDGGQDVLFPFTRFSTELHWNKRNTLVFLYQPLKITSQVLLNEDLVVDDLLFPAASSVNLLYNFPFYRLSYMRELVKKPTHLSFALGGSLQLRNATISFESTDGSRFRTNRDIGPVPVLRFRSKLDLNKNVYMELESDGIYAPVSYLNGSDNEVIGAILDASFRTGVQVNDPVKAFLNLRYLGGGAVGTSDDPQGPGDGYVKNWLNFGTVTLGFVYDF